MYTCWIKATRIKKQARGCSRGTGGSGCWPCSVMAIPPGSLFPVIRPVLPFLSLYLCLVSVPKSKGIKCPLKIHYEKWLITTVLCFSSAKIKLPKKNTYLTSTKWSIMAPILHFIFKYVVSGKGSKGFAVYFSKPLWEFWVSEVGYLSVM